MIFVKDPPNSNDISSNGSLRVDNDLHSFLNEHAELFIDDIPSELPPKRRDDDHRIDLILGSSPSNKPHYRVSWAQQEEIMSQVNELVQKGMLTRRAGRHVLCRLIDKELPYYSSNGEFRHRIPKKLPSDYTRKGDGEKIKRGELHKAAPKAEPPLAGAFKLRDNPPNTLVITFLNRQLV
ncbi:hypothetical protein L7F22_065895 [Adiantum nelumboides]|nr:hypothetical protein [Adiantum nelumboides]